MLHLRQTAAVLHPTPHPFPPLAELTESTRQALGLWKKTQRFKPYVGFCGHADVLRGTDRQRTADAQMSLRQEPVAFPQR